MPPAPALPYFASSARIGLALLKTMPSPLFGPFNVYVTRSPACGQTPTDEIEGLDVSMHAEEGYNFEA
jgi:hypothetical protein